MDPQQKLCYAISFQEYFRSLMCLKSFNECKKVYPESRMNKTEVSYSTMFKTDDIAWFWDKNLLTYNILISWIYFDVTKKQLTDTLQHLTQTLITHTKLEARLLIVSVFLVRYSDNEALMLCHGQENDNRSIFTWKLFYVKSVTLYHLFLLYTWSVKPAASKHTLSFCMQSSHYVLSL